MFIPRIFYPNPLNKNQTVTLDDNASHYVTKVLRLKEGEQLCLFNGQGGEYQATLSRRNKNVMVQVIEHLAINRESKLEIHLGQGISRAERMDYVVQKTSELGVTEITPLETKRSVVKLDDSRKAKRQAHWEKVAISASEQSLRTAIPTVHPPISLKEWAALPFDGVSVYFDTTNTAPIQSLPSHTQFRIAIGPESGWDEDESAFLSKHQFIPLSLGPRVLRTETAGVVAISIIQGLWGDLSYSPGQAPD